LISYHQHDELREELNLLQANFPGDAEVFSLGTSRLGRNIDGIRISKDLLAKKQVCTHHAKLWQSCDMDFRIWTFC